MGKAITIKRGGKNPTQVFYLPTGHLNLPSLAGVDHRSSASASLHSATGLLPIGKVKSATKELPKIPLFLLLCSSNTLFLILLYLLLPVSMGAARDNIFSGLSEKWRILTPDREGLRDLRFKSPIMRFELRRLQNFLQQVRDLKAEFTFVCYKEDTYTVCFTTLLDYLRGIDQSWDFLDDAILFKIQIRWLVRSYCTQ